MNKDQPKEPSQGTSSGPKKDKRRGTGTASRGDGDGAGASPWKGAEVDPTWRSSESPEAAAGRAEGNAPVRADSAEASEVGGTPAGAEPRPQAQGPTAARRTGGRAGGLPQSADSADSAETVEEKRRAAAEEHARTTPKRSPHGKL
jgi:hypothetical protein